MYVTAQRVVSPHTHQMGVNVYQYLHGSDWGPVPVPEQFLPDHNPGELYAHRVELAPPGNRVLSYLDVVLPDGAAPLTARDFLLSLKWALPTRGLPTSRRIGNAWARFNVAQMRVPPTTELGALAGHIVLSIYPNL